MGYLYIAGCIVFTVYGQLIIKWRMNQQLTLPDALQDKVIFLVKLILLDPLILSGFVSAFIASLFWMAAMTKFSLSFAYPFMSLAFVLVMFCSVLLFNEVLNIYKVLGTFIVILGVYVLSRGY